MKIVGIDPGRQGAIVILDSHSDEKSYFIFPQNKDQIIWQDVAEYFRHLMHVGDIHVFIEKVSSRPGQGVKSVFSFGHNFGMLHGFCTIAKLPITFVPPAVWTKEMHQGIKSVLGPKDKSLQAALNLAPNSAQFFRAYKKSENFHDGVVDAFLIALYGKRRGMNLVVSSN